MRPPCRCTRRADRGSQRRSSSICRGSRRDCRSDSLRRRRFRSRRRRHTVSTRTRWRRRRHVRAAWGRRSCSHRRFRCRNRCRSRTSWCRRRWRIGRGDSPARPVAGRCRARRRSPPCSADRPCKTTPSTGCPERSWRSRPRRRRFRCARSWMRLCRCRRPADRLGPDQPASRCPNDRGYCRRRRPLHRRRCNRRDRRNNPKGNRRWCHSARRFLLCRSCPLRTRRRLRRTGCWWCICRRICPSTRHTCTAYRAW